jgi:hypothetical protein
VNYDPLPPEKLRSAATSTDPTTAIYAVAKRIPVRMRLVIDERSLPKLLANCGNHEIPVEVRQVRINCPEGQTGGGGGYGDFGGVASRTSPRTSSGTSSNEIQDLNRMDVEVYGIVYIFNPVDEAMLGVQLRDTLDTTSEPRPAPPTASLPGSEPGTRR